MTKLEREEKNSTVLLRAPALYQSLQYLGQRNSILRRIVRALPCRAKILMLKARGRLLWAVRARLVSSQPYPPMDATDRQWMRDRYADDVHELRRHGYLPPAAWEADFGTFRGSDMDIALHEPTSN